LVERARLGDRDAFTQLAAEAVDRLYRVAYRILREPEAARDATQHALLEAWRDIPSLRDPDRWEAWTYRLLVRACYRERRREHRLMASLSSLPAEGTSVPDAAAGVADRDELERGFRRLRREHRAVIVLHHYLGLPLTEVARILGIPSGTARSRLHYALQQLRASLADANVPPQTEGRTA
jgi:RNA polymerase sigma-70 factor (ECF subfamily)